MVDDSVFADTILYFQNNAFKMFRHGKIGNGDMTDDASGGNIGKTTPKVGAKQSDHGN